MSMIHIVYYLTVVHTEAQPKRRRDLGVPQFKPPTYE